MGFLLFPIAIAAAAAVILFRWARQVRRRNGQSWESLVARLQPARTLRELPASATPEERWLQVEGAQGLCAMYLNAKVLLQMADYAACHGESVDRELLAALRSDALQIRLLVIRALTHYAAHRLNDGIGVSALRAATLYQEMAARMSALLDGNGGPAAHYAGARP
ncbi:MAG: hypothetical protein ACLGP3_09725 [Acidobacteriota bacterium]